jgi:hypothetical protein
MGKIILCFLLVLAIIFAVPFVVYAAFSAVTGLRPPGDSPLMFLLGVLISKAGTAAAFVLLYYFAQGSWNGQWLLYAVIWLLMFVAGEAGQALGPNYGWQEAIAGIISESIYLPLAAYLASWLIEA